MAQGSFGKVEIFEDFLGGFPDGAWAATGMGSYGNLSFTSDDEGSATIVVDEPGGVIQLTTDVGDDDSIALFGGTWKPSDGGMTMEVRLKIPTSVAATRAAVWVGFAETLSLTAPVMPFETATTTTTYNAGGHVGFGFDSDATTLAWRFGAGDGSAALATATATGTVGGAIGITVNDDTVTADRWYLFRVEVLPDGTARGYFGDIGTNRELKYIGKTTAALGVSDTFHAVVMIENRSGANEELEVDYVYACGFRDWSAS